MDLTRVDSKKLRLAVAEATKLLDKAASVLEPFAVALTDKERQTMAKPRAGFETAARKLAGAMKARPEIASITEFDCEAVTEDLDNVTEILQLEPKIRRLEQLVGDSRLTWLAEAYEPSLAAYGVAQVRAKKDGTLDDVLQPMADIFATKRSRAKKVAQTPPAKQDGDT